MKKTHVTSISPGSIGTDKPEIRKIPDLPGQIILPGMNPGGQQIDMFTRPETNSDSK